MAERDLGAQSERTGDDQVGTSPTRSYDECAKARHANEAGSGEVWLWKR